MPRQRIRATTSPLAFFGLLPSTLLALALIWYGAMVVLLAAKVSPADVNRVSGYRTVYRFVSGLGPADIDARVRLIAGLIGLATFLIGSYLAARSLARPYLARTELTLDTDGRGGTTVQPRAIERAIESAALGQAGVRAAAGRYEAGEMSLNVALGNAADAAEMLRETRRRARAALDEHDLPVLPVNVTLTGYQQNHRRELQ